MRRGHDRELEPLGERLEWRDELRHAPPEGVVKHERRHEGLRTGDDQFHRHAFVGENTLSLEAERLTGEGHCLVPGLEGDDPLLGPADDALWLHLERQIDDDSQRAASPEHRRKELVVGGEHADLARRRHHREPRHALSEQSEPAREIATQAAVDDIADDPDPGPRPHW